ncbi:MAG: hypothetical protein ACE5Z5_05320 [Candidatus Bathyarchaeia archaeon]
MSTSDSTVMVHPMRLAGIEEAAVMVDHYLRNPLQGIIVNIFLAKERLKKVSIGENLRRDRR